LLRYRKITAVKSFIIQASGIFTAVPYSWLARWLEVVGIKLNVVILPVKVVQYCRQPLGGLKIKKTIKQRLNQAQPNLV
jgi:hypothetical protein